MVLSLAFFFFFEAACFSWWTKNTGSLGQIKVFLRYCFVGLKAYLVLQKSNVCHTAASTKTYNFSSK